jgi:hypothetical protein
VQQRLVVAEGKGDLGRTIKVKAVVGVEGVLFWGDMNSGCWRGAGYSL